MNFDPESGVSTRRLIAAMVVVAMLAVFAGALAGEVGGAVGRPARVPVSSGTEVLQPPTVEACPVNTPACRIADNLARYLRFSDFDSVFLYAEATPTVCLGPGIPADQLSPLCDGAAAGELRNGFPVSFGAASSRMVNGAQLRNLVRVATGDPTRLRLAGIGCRATAECERLVVVFATGDRPEVVYFAFEARPSPGQALLGRLSGFGTSGDNAADIVALRPSQTSIGWTTFVPYVGTP